MIWREAVKQAAKAFDEVMDVIKRSDATIKKKRRALEGARYAMEFLDYKKNVSVWFLRVIFLKVDMFMFGRFLQKFLMLSGDDHYGCYCRLGVTYAKSRRSWDGKNCCNKDV